MLPAEVPILDVEPDVGVGVAGALRLAVSKGYLEREDMNKPSASRFAHLQAQNYSIEDKTHMWVPTVSDVSDVIKRRRAFIVAVAYVHARTPYL